MPWEHPSDWVKTLQGLAPSGPRRAMQIALAAIDQICLTNAGALSEDCLAKAEAAYEALNAELKGMTDGQQRQTGGPA